jgi:hypothetical protein
VLKSSLCVFFKEKVHFDHPTLAKVWFWPSNSKIDYFRPSNYQNCSNFGHWAVLIGCFLSGTQRHRTFAVHPLDHTANKSFVVCLRWTHGDQLFRRVSRLLHMAKCAVGRYSSPCVKMRTHGDYTSPTCALLWHTAKEFKKSCSNLQTLSPLHMEHLVIYVKI